MRKWILQGRRVLALSSRSGIVSLLLTFLPISGLLLGCHGKDTDSAGWLSDGDLSHSKQSIAPTLESVYGVPVPPRWCKLVLYEAHRVFAGKIALGTQTAHSPINCALGVAEREHAEVLVRLSPYFVFQRHQVEASAAARTSISGNPAVYLGSTSVSVAIAERMALTISLDSLGESEASLTDDELRELALELADRLMAHLHK